MRQILLLSGRICNGKTQLAKRLEDQFGFMVVKTSDILSQEAARRGRDQSRKGLQDIGNEIDKETRGKWIADHVEKVLENSRSNQPLVVDCVKNRRQLSAFRLGRGWHVEHAHLYARLAELRERYAERSSDGRRRGMLSYEEADFLKHSGDVASLKKDADVRINTSRTDVGDTFIRVAARLGIFSNPQERLVDVLIGGQYGSEGKGHVAAYLAPEYDVLVRVGGPNAGHTVLTSSGEFVFHHLPSGSLESDAKILIGPGAVINVEKFLEEVKRSGVNPERIFIDPQSVIIEEEDITSEKDIVREIASTGQGVGAANARKITHRYCGGVRLAKDVPELEKFVGTEEPYRGATRIRLEEAFSRRQLVLLEGTQGSGLSIHHGLYPYVTSRDTNVSGCLAEAGISPARLRRILMVVRSHPIRVANPDDGNGWSGFLKNETTFETIARSAKLNLNKIKKHERTSTTKRARRVGMFDWELFRRSCQLNSPTDIVLTFADYIHADNGEARRFEQLTEDTIKWVEELERVAQAPVSLINTRFPRGKGPLDRRSVVDRRFWANTRRRLENVGGE